MTQVIQKPFQPHGTVSTQAVGAASANVAINNAGRAHRTLRIVNSGTQVIFVKAGAGSQTATNADIPVLANTVFYLYMQPEWDNVAVIAGSTGSTAYLQIGEGGIGG